jgi:hypothetical protein
MVVGKVISGFTEAWKQRKVVLLLYTLQLVIALPIGIQVYQVMEASIGASMSLNSIQEGFNRTVVEDFLNVHGSSITPLIGTFRYVVPMFLIFSIFLHAGIMGNVVHGKTRIADFFRSGVRHFKYFVGYDLVFFLIVIFWSLLVWLPFLWWMGNPTEDLSSEKILVIGLIIVGSIYLFGLSLIWILAFDMKLSDIEVRGTWKQGFSKGVRRWKSDILSQWAIFISYVIIHLIAILLYLGITDPIGASSIWLIVFVMLLQQMFSILRIGMRIALFKSLSIS